MERKVMIIAPCMGAAPSYRGLRLLPTKFCSMTKDEVSVKELQRPPHARNQTLLFSFPPTLHAHPHATEAELRAPAYFSHSQ